MQIRIGIPFVGGFTAVYEEAEFKEKLANIRASTRRVTAKAVRGVAVVVNKTADLLEPADPKI